MREFVKVGKYETRGAVYRMSAEAARIMYKSRGAHDKNTPFMKYLLDCINTESGLIFPVTKIELI